MPREDSEFDTDVSDVDAVICNWLFVHHDIKQFKSLKYIQLLSAGLDRVPLDHIKEKDIMLNNARGVYSIPMAEYAVGGVLQLYKKARFFSRNQQEHIWLKNREILELSDSTVAVIGCGSVGQETAKRFGAFTENVYGVDLYPNDSSFFKKVYPLAQLDAVISNSDIVVLTLPLTEQTRGMFGKERLAVMRKDAVIVNISRGGIIDEEALADALEDHIGGAVLDVFEEEPLPSESRLWEMENVIITPHISFQSNKNDMRMWQAISENIRRFAGERNRSNE
ncbi:MAG: D-2-hydroxyacid dehydrogenase [Alistipes sp.]|nr:D-2-hydroxyacid dehydrogenase [Alistipes sp.]